MADGLYEIHQIIGRRVTASGKEEYLVHWKNYDYLNRTWEPLENLTSCLSTVTSFLAKAFPMPGVTASQVVHLKAKPHSQARRNMPVTDINKRKLRRLLGNKELVHEILKEKSKNLSEKKRNKRGRPKRKLDEVEVLNEGLEEQQETTLNGRRMLRSVTDTSPQVMKRRRQSSWGGSRSLARLIQNSIHLSHAQGLQESPQVEEPKERPIRTTRTQGEMAENVSVTKEDKVWKVTLCNEKKQNVLTIQMCEQLTNILHEAGKEDVKVLMLTGAGDCFCGGLDYSLLVNNPHYKADAKEMVEKFEYVKHFNKLYVHRMC